MATAWRLKTHESLPSTSDLCRELAEAGEPEGFAALARRQTAGRGSRGREWIAPIGNLNLSVLLRPRERAASAGQWSLLAAVALAEALAPADPRVKWPNDLLLDGRKVAGILLDSADDGQGSLAWLVIGIGVNLSHVPEGYDGSAGTLRSAEAPEAVAARVLERIDAWRRVRLLEGFGPVRAAWLSRAHSIGETISLRVGGERVGGQFAGLGEDGSLMLQSGGRVRAFATGEVLLAEPKLAEPKLGGPLLDGEG